MMTFFGAVLLHAIIVGLLYCAGMKARWIGFIFSIELFIGAISIPLKNLMMARVYGYDPLTDAIIFAATALLGSAGLFIFLQHNLLCDLVDVHIRRKESFKFRE